MKLINKVKNLFSENYKEQEADYELQHLHLLDRTHEDNCSNVISLRKGPGNWRSTLMKLYNFKSTLTPKQQDYYFSFVGMKKDGVKDFEEYLTSHSHDKVWKKLLYEHNDTDEFMDDIKNIYRRVIYYHKFNRLKTGKNLIANTKVMHQILYKIMVNKAGFALDKPEIHFIEYTSENSLSEGQFRELIEGSTEDDDGEDLEEQLA